MTTKDLGRLQKVGLREVWQTESAGFTPWLAQEENLKLLGETIDIEIELEAQEKDVGPFRADLLCKDTSNENWVLIENQLERTDHTHLGQLLTYAAGLDAVTIVWISERFTEEHRAALDWLNEHTDEKINFFGLEVELWRIGASDIAPKFNIISKPNEWARSVQQAASGGELSEHKRTQLRFWTAFRTYMEDQGSSIKCQKPYPQHWMNHSIGRSGFHLSSIASMWNSETSTNDPEILVELVMDGRNAKPAFEALEQQREEIDKALGLQLTWHNPEGKNTCRIYTRMNADFLNEPLWPQQHQWLREKLELFHKFFAPRVKSLE